MDSPEGIRVNFIYAPAPPPPHRIGPETSLVAPHFLGLSFFGLHMCMHIAHVGMLKCTRIMLLCTRRPLLGGILYIKPLRTYALYCLVRNASDACRGLGPRNFEFLGPKWHLPIGLLPFQGLKNSFQGPTPSHLPS
jgi:hypothetical protein